MKRLLSALCVCALLGGAFALAPAAVDIDWGGAKPRADIALRDPCVLAHGGLYYVYGTGAAWPGYGCYVSRDLEDWAGPYRVFAPPEGHDGAGDWWAPECHAYLGKFYLFASYRSASLGHRRTSVFRADSPLGPFEEIFDIRSYPDGWDTIDGTLYVDGEGQPWMVFVHEWTSMPDGVGGFSAAKLSGDLSRFVSEPAPLFKASAMPLFPFNTVTDGCWLYRSETGRLIMLWSGFRGGYNVAQAVSLSGEIAGPWVQCPMLLYGQNSAFPLDGGHGSLFSGPGGRLTLSIHSPNGTDDGRLHEAPVFLEAADMGASLALKDNSAPWLRGMAARLWDAAVWAMSGAWGLLG
ncbi:MAG: family 43 glycosylhydrolase [Oscillospiraceae bacterium]|jgi:beta-xylosidase|nr:family 43 glycosylhydrolase [Oscillospiraceae bacterium]